MNLNVLLIFVPLAIGITWLFYLIFRANLATQPLGKIISYFLGVVIIALTVGWLIDNLLPLWFNDRVQNANQSVEWQQFVGTSTDLIDQSFSATNNGVATVPAPTAVPVINATPISTGTGETPILADQMDNSGGSIVHVVTEGDTLLSLSRQYNVSVDDIRVANNRASDFIYVGEELVIPQADGGGE